MIRSRLLKLPAELRNQIYALALDQDSYRHVSVPKEPALLHTNHQLRREALPIFHLVLNDLITDKILGNIPIDIQVEYSDHRTIHINIDWHTAVIARDRQQTLGKMLLWYSETDGEDYLHVCINMRESYCHSGWPSELEFKIDELGLGGIPTVSELVKVVPLHPKMRVLRTR